MAPPDQVQRDQHRPARQAIRERLRHRRDADISNHLDRQRGAQHRPRICPGQIVGQKAQGHGHQPGAQQRDHLRREQMSIGAVAQDG